MSRDGNYTTLPKRAVRSRKERPRAISAVLRAPPPSKPESRRASAPVTPPAAPSRPAEDYFSPKPYSPSPRAGLDSPDGIYFPRLHPVPLAHQLKCLLRTDQKYVHRFLDIDDLLACYDTDLMEAAHRRSVRSCLKSDFDSNLTVFGVSLKRVVMYASSGVLFGDYKHDMPIVVHACVQELYKRTFHEEMIFGRPAERDTLLRLITEYDTSPGFGKQILLDDVATETIFSLLLTFFSSLPEPIISPIILEAIWTWCIRPDLPDGPQNDANSLIDRVSCPNFVQFSGSGQIDMLIAKALLLLLPSPNLSLFVFLITFLKQVSSNGISGHELAKRFGPSVLGLRKKPGERGDFRSPIILAWFLSRWSFVSDDILGSSSMAESTQCSSSSLHQSRSCQSPGTDALNRTPKPQRRVEDEAPVIPTITLGRDVVVLDPSEGLFNGDELSILERSSQLSHDSSSQVPSSHSSSCGPLNIRHRMRDTGKPPALGQSVNSESGTTESMYTNSDCSSLDVRDQLLWEANQQIAELEREIRRGDDAVMEAFRETFEARQRADSLERQVRLLESREDRRSELLFAYGVGIADDPEVLIRRLEDVLLEKDSVLREKEDALQQLEKFKALISVGDT